MKRSKSQRHGRACDFHGRSYLPYCFCVHRVAEARRWLLVVLSREYDVAWKAWLSSRRPTERMLLPICDDTVDWAVRRNAAGEIVSGFLYTDATGPDLSRGDWDRYQERLRKLVSLPHSHRVQNGFDGGGRRLWNRYVARASDDYPLRHRVSRQLIKQVCHDCYTEAES